MAHSIQTFDGRARGFDDMDLLVFLGLASEVLDAQADRYGLLGDLAATWTRARVESGPGTIELDLDSLVGESARLEQLAGLLDEVAAAAASFGETIPAAVLNGRYRVDGVRFADYASERIAELTQQLRALTLDAPAPGA